MSIGTSHPSRQNRQNGARPMDREPLALSSSSLPISSRAASSPATSQNQVRSRREEETGNGTGVRSVRSASAVRFTARAPSFAGDYYRETPLARASKFIRQLLMSGYNYFLFNLPALYFLQVSRVFVDVDLSISNLRCIVLESSVGPAPPLRSGLVDSSEPYEQLKRSWNQLINDLIEEWKTLNIISVLLFP